MLLSLIRKILARHDQTVKSVEEIEAEREVSFKEATDAFCEMADELTESLAASDQRFERIVKKQSYTILFKGEIVLQITIFNLTDRVEVKMNHKTAFIFKGGIQEAAEVSNLKFWKEFEYVAANHLYLSFTQIEKRLLARI